MSRERNREKLEGVGWLRRGGGLLFVYLSGVAVLFWPGGGQAGAETRARCRLGPVKRTVQKRGACTVVRLQRQARKKPIRVRLTAEVLRCGRLRLGHPQRLFRQGLQVCQNNASNDMMHNFSLFEKFRLVARWGRYLAVEKNSGGFTGGAHGSNRIERRTYDVGRGRVVTLSQLFPRRARRLLRRIRRRFKKKNKKGGFAWDAKAFALRPRQPKILLEFAFPHAVELYRGQTLVVSLLLRRGPAVRALPTLRRPITQSPSFRRNRVLRPAARRHVLRPARRSLRRPKRTRRIKEKKLQLRPTSRAVRRLQLQPR